MPLRLMFGVLVAACTCSAASHPDWDALRSDIKSILQIPAQLPATAEKHYDNFKPAQGVTAERVSYATSYGLRIPAIVYHPGPATIARHPALIVVNGHQGDKSSWYSYWAGILYARAGAIVLTYDPIGEYERNAERRSRTNQHDQVLQPEQAIAQRLTGLMVTDVMQAVSYLETRPDVDPKRIAVLGFSLGSFLSSLACAIDTRIDACVLVGGGDLDGPGGHFDNNAKPMCESIAYQSLKSLGDRGAVIFALNAKRGPTLIYNGSDDTTADIPHHGPEFFADLKKRTISELGGSDKNVFDYGFVAGGKHAPYFLTKAVALWLEEKLKFPDWTKKQIQQMPGIQVRDWAVAKHIEDADRLPAMMALGNNIPAIPREDLHAVPDTVWDSERASVLSHKLT